MTTKQEQRRVAFEAMFRELWPRAYRVAYRVLGEVPAAEDAAAEAFARTLVSWRRVGSLGYREAWVLRVTANVAVDMARRRARRPRGWIGSGRGFEDDAVNRVALADALTALPRRQREVVALRYLAGCGEDDVAEALGIAKGTVKEHAKRARSHLRGLLDEAEEEGREQHDPGER